MLGTYVMRPVADPDSILQWAWERGLRWSLEPSDLHVTLLYSETPVFGVAPDPSSLDLQIRSGVLTELGPKALVMEITDGANVLHLRHEELLAHGGSSTYSSYRAHVTISYRKPPRRRTPKKPYIGRLRLGPEHWAPLDTLRAESIREIPLRRLNRAAAWEFARIEESLL